MTEVDATACADAYRALRERVSELVRAADPTALDAVAPATPEWRVRDVFAHMVGVNSDIVSGTLAGVGTDPWTAVQVDTRRDVPIEVMLEEHDDEEVTAALERGEIDVGFVLLPVGDAPLATVVIVVSALPRPSAVAASRRFCTAG